MDYYREKHEAYNAGQKALYSLKEAQREISGAKGFGLWDLLGGGSFVSLAKHFKINRAKDALNRARYDLLSFSKELQDISYNLDIDISDFLAVFDLFDSFIADVIVQSKLADASRKIDQAIGKVEDAMRWLS